MGTGQAGFGSAPNPQGGDEGLISSAYPALRFVDRSGLAAFFFSAPRFPSMGRSISFWPAEAFRGPLPFGVASLAKLFFNASMRSTTFSPRGRGLDPIVFPLRLALLMPRGLATYSVTSCQV
jgi:hypothetical protein